MGPFVFRAISIYFLSIGQLIAASSGNHPEIKIGVVQEWSHPHPVTYNLASTEAFLGFVVRPLVNRSANGELVADLAETIPSQKNKLVQIAQVSGKSKVIAQWTIKKNANWGDSRPVTCKDWWLGWQVGLSPNVSTLEKGTYQKIENIEWSSEQPKKCKVTYATDEWTFDRDLPYPLPAHLEEAVFEKWKGQAQAYEQNSTYVKDPTNKGLYCGPYLIEQYVLGSHFVLTKNSQFFGKAPQVSRIVVKHVGEASTLRAQLQTQEINMVSAVGFPPDLAFLLKEEFEKKPGELQVQLQDSPIFQGLFFNLESELLKDRRVREAIWKSIDKVELTKAFFQGNLLPAETFIPPQNPGFIKRPGQYSLSEAKKILEEMGWKAGPGGLRKKDGKDLIFEFRTSAGIKVLETIQTYLCSQFQKIGAQCLIKNQPPRVFLGDSVPHGDFMLAMFGQPILPDTSLKNTFASAEIPNKANSWTGQNSTRWKNTQMDEKLKQFDLEWSPQKRTKMMKEMESIILTEKPFVPLYHRREAIVLPKKLVGVQADINGTGFLFPENWTWKN